MKLLYKYCSIETAIKIIDSGSILFNTPNNFKDKKDVPIDLVDFNFTKMHKEYVDELEELKKSEPLYKDSISLPENVKHLYRLSLIDKYYKSKITCFSLSDKSNFSSNYHADFYRGVFFQFDLNNIFSEYTSLFLAAGKVNYIKKYKNIDFFKYPKRKFYDYFLYNKLESKYKNEQEFRFVYLKNSDIKEKYKFFKFNPDSLIGVRFGKNCLNADKQKILNLLAVNGINAKII